MTAPDPATALALFGTTQPVSPARRLVAGPLTCDLCDGSLQDVRWHGVEIVRSVAYLLRDRDWGTVPATLDALEIEETGSTFTARFELSMTTPDARLRAAATLRGDAQGRLHFEVAATPDADLRTNRCGFVVLHPAELAGAALRVEHTGGGIGETSFPRLISPAQPVLDIRALRFAPAAGIRAECRLEAALPHDPAGKFEMEDQRNWSDASFKTYVASLLDPWPYTLLAGRPLAQSVTLTMQGRPVDAAGATAVGGAIAIALGAAGAARLPAIGVGVPPGLCRASDAETATLRRLAAGWWIVEAALADPALADDLAAAAALRAHTRVAVQIDAIVPDALSPDAAAARLAALCAAAGLQVDAVRLLPAAYLASFQPAGDWPRLPPLEDYAQAARTRLPGARIGGGMYTSFTELNRKRPAARGLDFIGHLTCPIVHAPDDASVMQSIEALPHIVRSVRALWPSLGYRLGPSTIGIRRNPYGTSTTPNPQGERVALAAADPRHHARFGAAWTLAHAAAVAPLGLELLALHESHGPRGPHPGGAADVVPAWDVLATLARAAGARIVPLSGLPAQVAGLAWEVGAARVQGLLANLSATPRRVRWREPVDIAGERAAAGFELGPLQVVAFAAPAV